MIGYSWVRRVGGAEDTRKLLTPDHIQAFNNRE